MDLFLGSGSGSHSYAYDDVGNLISKDGATLTVDDANQIISSGPPTEPAAGFVGLPGPEVWNYVVAPDAAGLGCDGDIDIRVVADF